LTAWSMDFFCCYRGVFLLWSHMDIVPYSHHTVFIITICSLHFFNNIDSKLCHCHPYGSSVLNCSFICFLPCYSYSLLQYILINTHIFESFNKICFCSIIPVNQGNLRCRESSSLYHTCSFAYNKHVFDISKRKSVTR